MIPTIYRRGGTGEDETDFSPAVPDGGDSFDPSSDPHLENQAIIAGQKVPVVGDHAEHLKVHARFAMTPLGRALTEDSLEKLKNHMRGHVNACIGAGSKVSDWGSASKLAMLMHGVGEDD